jgi:hypothetical protein
VQLDLIKPTPKAPEIKLLKLISDVPLSCFGFKFNLRRHSKAAMRAAVTAAAAAEAAGAAQEAAHPIPTYYPNIVGRGLHSSTFQLNQSRFCLKLTLSIP